MYMEEHNILSVTPSTQFCFLIEKFNTRAPFQWVTGLPLDMRYFFIIIPSLSNPLSINIYIISRFSQGQKRCLSTVQYSSNPPVGKPVTLELHWRLHGRPE